MRLVYVVLLLVTVAAGGLAVYALGEIQSLGVALRAAYTRAAMAQVQDQIAAWTTIGVASAGVALAGFLALGITPAIVRARRSLRELRRINDSTAIR
jgi:hypothetical protein